MFKEFLKNNQRRKQLIDKFAKIKNKPIETEQEKYEYLQYLLAKNGNTYYVNNSFDIEILTENLKEYYSNKQKVKIEFSELNDIKIINIYGNRKITNFLGLTKPVTIILGKFANTISYHFINSEWFNNPVIDEKNEKNNSLTSIFVDNIEVFILEHIESTIDKSLFEYASNDNYFVESINHRNQQFFISERENDEILLAWLNVGSIKNLGLNKDFYKKLTWFYILTNKDSFLIGFNKYGDVLEAFDFQSREMNIKHGIRNSVYVNDYEWYPTLNNSLKYSIVAEASKLSQLQKVNFIARKNFELEKKYDYVKFLVNQTDFPTVGLTTFFINYFIDSQNAIEVYSENNKIIEVLSEVLKHPQIEETLVFWYNDWQPNVEQSVFITKMFIESAKDISELRKLLPFHNIVYKYITKKEKDYYNKILYDIEFSKHLIALEKFKEAELILKYDLKKLPDLTLTELLPPENIDPTGSLSGQFLKVIILELLSKTQKNDKMADFIRQAAILQPLSLKRIYQLTKVGNNHLKTKAQTVLETIKGEDLKPIESKHGAKFKPVSANIVEKMKHPVYRKKGKLSSFSKWISSYKRPDTSTMKDIGEKFDPKKHKDVADILADVLQVFNIPILKIYIAHGNHSVGVRSYEADLPFLIIGNEHLDPKSPHYFTYNELSFAIAQEVAFIYFKFARITSSDIWRGAMEKGTFVVDTLIDLIPFAGNVSKVLKNASKFKKISNFMEKSSKLSNVLAKTDQIEQIANKSRGVLLKTSDMLKSLDSSKTNKKENLKQKEIIAISRMMQLTADRVGLLFCNDPVSAVRSAFLSSKELISHLPTIQKYGLNSFLLKKDENENFVNLNFAVRFASMFSFWISDDFDNIRNLMTD